MKRNRMIPTQDPITTLNGQLEIDHRRGVIYFQSTDKIILDKGMITVLRICRLPPIPEVTELLDLTHMVGTSWDDGETRKKRQAK